MIKQEILEIINRVLDNDYSEDSLNDQAVDEIHALFLKNKKNRWIPGPPTKPGWYWIRFEKYQTIIHNGYNPEQIDAPIIAHSPISEPEEDYLNVR